MTNTSWFFFIIFLIPLCAFLFWLMKQDRKKGIIGAILLIIMIVSAIVVSFRASKNAVNNFEMRKNEAKEQQN